MVYKIDYYSKERANKRDSYYRNGPIFFAEGIDTNKIFFDYLTAELGRIKRRRKGIVRILDLGTGTGYIPKLLGQISKSDYKIIGIDLSEPMLEKAKKENKDSRVEYQLADNKELPFKDEYFDIVTNKLSTQFSPNEVARVLKKDGIFIFKEYDQCKGFREVSKLFKSRYSKIPKQPDEYAEDFNRLGFREVSLQKFLLKRSYTAEEVADIFSMANLVDNFGEPDLKKIISSLSKDGTINITSDPFLLFARK